jgi:cation-dependent mannose-6-phosphate receptor
VNRQQNSELVVRGSKLVLNYTNGSPCDSDTKDKRELLSHDAEDIKTLRLRDYDDDEDNYRGLKKRASKDKVRRKGAIISLLCQKDPLGPKAPKATLAFLGTLDHCTYFFEARSQAACAGIETTPQQLGPGGVFGVM